MKSLSENAVRKCTLGKRDETMMELFDRIDQGLYDWAFFVLALVAALIVAVPVRREEREK